jgi:elongation factor 1-gamma
VVAKANGLDIEVVEVPTGEKATADYLKYNKLGKIPTFVGADGYVLTECVAIAIYSKLYMLCFIFSPRRYPP